MKTMIVMQQVYSAAIREVSTKLEILDDEFQVKFAHNPIHHMESRLKQPQSIREKLLRKGLTPDMKLATEHITDIAGIRVICYYINDIYTIAEVLLKQDDITLIKRSDYIENPKSNGYRSLHLVVSVPVFLSEGTRNVPVEVQIRTIAMDFWASLEHRLKYKSDSPVKDDLQRELAECAESITDIDEKMQSIYVQLNSKLE
nr:GTP pyrophosphokinase family protein [Desulfitobacterium hafniense]